jgi:phosphoribosylamine--glycine ligase
MEVLVVDPGARGHALARKIAESNLVDRVFMAPGNPGTSEIAENTGLAHTDIDGQIDFVRKNKNIGLVVQSADDPIAMGAINRFEEQFASEKRELYVWGPSKEAGEIESSKVFSKNLMRDLAIPTADYGVFNSILAAIAYARGRAFPQFAKEDGLAGGKGVSKVDSIHDVSSYLYKLVRAGKLGKEQRIVIEDGLLGPEISLQAWCDGENYSMVPFAMKDHKTIGDNDTGPMTGGMAVIGPVPGITKEDIDILGERFVAPVLKELSRLGTPFKGMLYPGLKGWKCLEYNARPGDAEAQVWAALLESDIVELMLACCMGELDQISKPVWKNAAAACIVLAAEGYPDDPKKGAVIHGLDSEFAIGSHILHAGTKMEGQDIVVDGGRTLNVVTVGDDGESLAEVIQTAYRDAKKIQFTGKQTRGDVGQEVLTTEFIEYVNKSRENGWN